MPFYSNSLRLSSTQPTQQSYAAAPTPDASGVQVMVRVRPPLPRELMYDSGVDVQPPYDIKVFNAAQEFSGRYHHVFGEEATQPEVYEKVRDCVPLALDGYNSTIFAYGQTGTGKTFTMMGDDPSVEGPGAAGGSGGAGIIPRAIKELFREAKAKQDAEGAAIQVIVSYMEIYNDRLHDLLQPYKPDNARDPADVNQRRAVLEVREDPRGATYVPNLLCVKVKSYKSVYQLIAKGNRNRAVRHTEMNQASSRSHAILQLVIEQWPNGGADGTVLRSKLNFVDLAGSERWSTAAAAAEAAAYGGAAPDLLGEDRIQEMTAINGSLSALGSVVAALTERRQHIPYRDSRLTHLLQDSLGGNCRTTLLATLSPSVDAFDESCSTLRFADRARAIANNPVVNASRDMGSILALKEREIQRLRAMLSQLTADGGGSGLKAAISGGGEGGDPGVARLAEELEETRRALEMERALRAELQQRLHASGAAAATDGGSGGGAAGVLVDATQVLALGSAPSTAFDAAGAPLRRVGSMRSSMGSGGSGTAGGGGADFFRLSTPSTPLNSLPPHLIGYNSTPGTSKSQSTPSSSSAVLTPTRARTSGGTQAIASSRGLLGSSGGRLLNASLSPSGAAAAPPRGGSASPPSPLSGGPRRRCDMRRLSFDEAIMSIKSQIAALTSQERARHKARQPPQQRMFWGGMPPPPLPPPAAADAAGPVSTRTRAAMGVYGNTGGSGTAAVRQQLAQYPRGPAAPPGGLSVPSGAVASAPIGGSGDGAGGAGAGLSHVHSIYMTDSAGNSQVPSPSSVVPPADHGAVVSWQGGRGVEGPVAGRAPSLPQEGRVTAAAAAGGKSPPRGERSGRVGWGEGGDGDSGAAGLRKRDEDEDGVVSEEEEEEEEEDVSEEEEAEEVPGRGKSSPARGGGGTSGKIRRSNSDSDEASNEEEEDDDEDEEEKDEEEDDADGGLSQLDPEEYEAVMREAREALARAGGTGAAATQAQTQTPPKAPGPPPGPPQGPPGGTGSHVVVSGTGWGRNALLHKFTDGDAAVGGVGGGGGITGVAGGGGGGFGRSSFMATGGAASGAPALVASQMVAAVPAPLAGAAPGGWGRRALLAAQSTPVLPTSLPPPQPASAPPTAAPRSPPGTGTTRRALIQELMAESDGGAGGLRASYGTSVQRMRASGGAGGGSKGRSRSVGGAGRPHGGSRGGAADRVAKLDAGSWIYILGASASSTRARHLASAILMDPRTGLPAL